MDQDDVYGAVWGLDRMPAPPSMATDDNPTWAPGSFLRETTERTIRTEAAVKRLDAKLDQILTILTKES